MIEYRDLADLAMKSLYAAQAIAGPRFEERLAPWRDLVRAVSEANKVRTVDTVYTFVCDLKSAGKLDGASAMWLMAVLAVEALEAKDEVAR